MSVTIECEPRNSNFKLRLAADQPQRTAPRQRVTLGIDWPDNYDVHSSRVAGPVQVQVGPHRYSVFLVRGKIALDRDTCLGICDFDHRYIAISDVQPVQSRVATFFHELAHAVVRSCDPSDAISYGDEAIAGMFELGLGTLDAATLARVYELLGA